MYQVDQPILPVANATMQKYFEQHVVYTGSVGHVRRVGVYVKHINQYRVVAPLHVFKKTTDANRIGSSITNLIIPVGAVICADAWAFEHSGRGYRKMRASRAIVHSSYNRFTKELVPKAHSLHDTSFTYQANQLVKPTVRFDKRRADVCSPGIHFFLDLHDALNY